MKEKILVSACLIGKNCKYDGGNNLNQKIVDYLKAFHVEPICPEIFGGLGCPRECSEIRDGKVFTASGKDVTKNFNIGAESVVLLARTNHISKAILKTNSPSCGYGKVYDGSFNSKLIAGNGLCAQRLKDIGVKIFTDEDEVFK